MRRPQHPSAPLTPQHLDAAINLLIRQLQDLAIQREIASYEEEQRPEDGYFIAPQALECTLMDRLISLRRIRTQQG